jgi:hypothetical protein
MINFYFVLSNPFSERFGVVYEKSGKTWMPHKFWEFSVHKDNSILKSLFEFSVRQDHAGLNFEFGILGWGVNFVLYDHRNWDDKNNCWENYEEMK